MVQGNRRLVVLLVEDNAVHARLICRHLAEVDDEGLRLEQVGQLSAALQRLSQGGVDVVLLDLSLPDSPVDETLGRVLASGCDVPVVVLTSLGDVDLATETVQQGAQDYLPKADLNGELLMRCIRSAIERKKSQRELKRYTARLERSNERLRSFAHMLAHEVKSPLTTVSGCLGILDDKYGPAFDEETRTFLRDARVATRGMSDLVTMLLEFARFGSRKRDFTEVDVEAVFYQAYAFLRGAIQDAGATVTHDPLPIVRGDELQIRQLLQNLISNAIKYRGASPPQIHMGVEEDYQNWTFRVVDNGCGVPPEYQQRVFDIFVRLPNTGDIPGTGIGLAFCKLIVDNHGGRIWLESSPGQGSSFYFTLPKRTPAPDQRERPPARQESQITVPSLPGE